MSKRVWTLSLCAATALCFGVGAAAQQFVYPAKGQTPEQQKKDEGECHGWAVGQSKYDPAKPPPIITMSSRI